MKTLKVLTYVIVMVMLSWQSAQATDVLTDSKSSKGKIREISQLIKRDPKNSQAYAERAALKVELQDMFGAIKDYSTALRLASGVNPTYLLGRANAFLEIGAYKEALSDYNQAIEATPSTELFYGRAVAKYYLDDYFGALRDLDQVVTSDPDHSKALYNRAVVKMELRQLDAAAEDLTNFLSHYPGHAEAERALAAADAVLQKHKPTK